MEKGRAVFAQAAGSAESVSALIVDAEAKTATLVGEFGWGRATRTWVEGVSMGDGRAVFAPCDASSALIVDAEAGTVDLLGDFGLDSSKWLSGAAFGHGRPVFAPF